MGVKGTIRKGGVSIEGDRELIAKLRALPEKIQRRVSLAAVRAGAKPVISSAAAKAPVQSGRLSRSIGARTKRYRTGAQATIAVIGARAGFGGDFHGYPRDPRYYAHLVELGTAAHLLPWLRQGDKLYKQWWMHPGAKPKPFLGPAWDGASSAALSRITSYLAARVEKEAAKK